LSMFDCPFQCNQFLWIVYVWLPLPISNIDNPEKLVTLEGAIKHRQSRETGYIGRGNQT
jgi:hypothetical protein